MVITNQIDGFFEKINGSFFALMALLIGFGGSMLAVVLYMMGDPSYSMFNNFISDLSIGPNGSNIVFFLFMATMPFVISPFYLYFTRSLQRLGASTIVTWIAYGTSVLSSLIQFLTAFFPLDPNNQAVSSTHLFFGILLAVFLGITQIIYSYLEFTQESVPKYSPILAFISAVLFLLFAFFLFLGSYTVLFDYNVITYLTEWSAFSVFMIWLLLKGYYFYRNPS